MEKESRTTSDEGSLRESFIQKTPRASGERHAHKDHTQKHGEVMIIIGNDHNQDVQARFRLMGRIARRFVSSDSGARHGDARETSISDKEKITGFISQHYKQRGQREDISQKAHPIIEKSYASPHSSSNWRDTQPDSCLLSLASACNQSMRPTIKQIKGRSELSPVDYYPPCAQPANSPPGQSSEASEPTTDKNPASSLSCILLAAPCRMYASPVRQCYACCRSESCQPMHEECE